MAIWRRGKPDGLLHHFDRSSHCLRRWRSRIEDSRLRPPGDSLDYAAGAEAQSKATPAEIFFNDG